MLNISDTFNKFNIENASFRIKKEDFEKLEPPFLAFYYSPSIGKDFVLITKIEKHTITIIDSKKNKVLPKEEFYKNWSDVVFLANVIEKSGEPQYAVNFQKERVFQNKKKVLHFGALHFTIVPPFIFLSNFNS